jgi:hypothetical protein
MKLYTEQGAVRMAQKRQGFRRKKTSVHHCLSVSTVIGLHALNMMTDESQKIKLNSKLM